jgi:hypothetical protein
MKARRIEMASDKQIQANILNAQSSTGPKTEEGKQASSANAVQHGLASENLVPVGARDLWDDIYADFCLEFGDDLASKRVLFEKMTNAICRERFCDEVEQFLYEFAAAEDTGQPLPTPEPGNQTTAFSFFRRMGLEKALNLVHRYRTTAMRQFKQSHDALLRNFVIERRVMKENAQARRQAIEDYVNAPLPDELHRLMNRTKPNPAASTTEIKR